MIVPIRCMLWKNLVKQCLGTCINYLYRQKTVQYLNWPVIKKYMKKYFSTLHSLPGVISKNFSNIQLLHYSEDVLMKLETI